MSVPSRHCSLDYNFEWKTSNSRLVLNVCRRENKRNLLYVLSKLFIFGLSDLQSRWLNNFQDSHRRPNPLCLQVCMYRHSISRSTLVLTVRCFRSSTGCREGTFVPCITGCRILPWIFCVINKPVKLFTTQKIKIFQLKNQYMLPNTIYELQ